MKTIFVPVLAILLPCGIWTKDAAAQTTTQSQPAARFIGWNPNEPKSQEVAVTAIIQQVVQSHASGTPAGLHLILGTPQGALDASFGPYLSQATQERLVTGKSIQVVGQVQTVRDQNYTFVRQLVVDGQTIKIRNDHGSLVHTRSHEHTQTLQNGGIQ